jgi:hypothetical protein
LLLGHVGLVGDLLLLIRHEARGRHAAAARLQVGVLWR